MLEDYGVLKKQIYYIEGSADELIERIRSEGENTKADVFHDSRSVSYTHLTLPTILRV